MTGKGICRDSLLTWRVLDFGRNFHPRGSGPVIRDVGTGGEEEQDDVEEEEEDEWEYRLVERPIPMGGQE